MSFEKIMNEFQDVMGINSTEIANHLGVDPAIITRIKKQNKTGSLHIPKIAKLLDVTPDQLVGGEYKASYIPLTKRSDLSRKIDRLIVKKKLTLKNQSLISAFVDELADRNSSNN